MERKGRERHGIFEYLGPCGVARHKTERSGMMHIMQVCARR